MNERKSRYDEHSLLHRNGPKSSYTNCFALLCLLIQQCTTDFDGGCIGFQNFLFVPFVEFLKCNFSSVCDVACKRTNESIGMWVNFWLDRRAVAVSMIVID